MHTRRALSALLIAASAAACGPAPESWAFGWFGSEEERAYAGHGPLRVRWTERITPEYEGAYLPVERAVAQLDPERNRLYVGSTAGHLYAMTGTGRRLYRYDAAGAIEAQPALDATRDELYVGTEQGELHALRASDGELRWREDAGGPIRKAPLLTADAVYVVTDSDTVAAFSREDGGSLWTYSRAAPETFSITEHAGLTLAGGKLLTGFTDGNVVALDPADGSVLWERDTSVEIDTEEGTRPRFVDVDTTPVAVGERVYIASFAGGLYALEVSSGTVLYKDASLTGVVALAVTDDTLILASADQGIVAIGLPDHERRWRKRLGRGSPTSPVIAGRHILVGESTGSFLALTLESGREVGRFDAGHGFTAPAAVRGGLGFVLSNGGSLFAFTY